MMMRLSRQGSRPEPEGRLPKQRIFDVAPEVRCPSHHLLPPPAAHLRHRVVGESLEIRLWVTPGPRLPRPNRVLHPEGGFRDGATGTPVEPTGTAATSGLRSPVELGVVAVPDPS